MTIAERISFLRGALWLKYAEQAIKEIGRGRQNRSKVHRRIAELAINRASIEQAFIEDMNEIADFAEWQNEKLVEERLGGKNR
ncbi:hypothetical protein JWG40_03785 [Leptospira sp. 201903074]|uniref:hypothetical protein n=1 Tax=Leptospira abararensis TaxID=2810036 RepID=UPI0019627A37|nr:hypothetical protein [Leptospira abararensis]MBM9546121.1 hypothetical protein [Leptospira abararensis]